MVKRTKTGEPDRNEKPREKKRRGNLVSNILILVGIGLLIAAGVIFMQNDENYRAIDEANERVAEYAKLTDDAETPPEVDWAGLKEMNPDIVGWLEVPGTIVNYPVFQTNNNDVYLNRAPDGSSSIGGSVFVDFENTKPGMVDAQTIIYGHHMRNGSQFKQIADMDKQELFDGVNLIWYVTEEKAYDMVPLFLYYTNEGDTDVRQFTFESSEAFHTYLRGYYERAVTKRADAEQIIAQAEHVMTLSTCNYYDGYGRTLLVCIPRSEVPGTPQYEAAAPERAERERLAAEKAAAEKAAAEAAAAEQAAAEAAAAEQEYVEYEEYEEY